MLPGQWPPTVPWHKPVLHYTCTTGYYKDLSLATPGLTVHLMQTFVAQKSAMYPIHLHHYTRKLHRGSVLHCQMDSSTTQFSILQTFIHVQVIFRLDLHAVILYIPTYVCARASVVHMCMHAICSCYILAINNNPISNYLNI